MRRGSEWREFRDFSQKISRGIFRKLRGMTWKYDRIDHTHLRGGAKPLSGRRGGGIAPPPSSSPKKPGPDEKDQLMGKWQQTTYIVPQVSYMYICMYIHVYKHVHVHALHMYFHSAYCI